MYRCPKCGGRLEVVLSDDVKLDKCTHCGGIWFDSGELYKLLTGGVSLMIDGIESDDTKEYNEKEGECPLCSGVKLNRIQSETDPELSIDKCPSCGGIWLERGELTSLTIKAKKTDLMKYIKV
jgi:Zn-finger nucleic acid-binding protein